MITIRYHDADDNRALTVQGHAGAAEKGKDIYCAAASTLMLTLLQALEKAEIDAIELIDEGFAYVQCTDPRAEQIFYTIMTGFYTLAMNYPKYYTMQTI